ncbi:recombinase family protein [Carnobacterium gallinarum]|uniref:recombinase family protein n=1 Tax=Carnobacterium gallinarum TaxID=2749 RepID=UPI003CCC1E30
MVKKLNSSGMTAPTERKKQLGINHVTNHEKLSGMWAISTISRILKNEVYNRQGCVCPCLYSTL